MVSCHNVSLRFHQTIKILCMCVVESSVCPKYRSINQLYMWNHMSYSLSSKFPSLHLASSVYPPGETMDCDGSSRRLALPL
jgi:hypothetical protein